jgi:hypothetical protein
MQPTFLQYADISLLQSYEMPFIQKVFHSICNDWNIEFDFPHGGCQQRAQMMSLLLTEKFNIQHCKVWLFAPAALYLNDTCMLHIKDAKKISLENIIEWNYHVAPALQINNNNKVETYILDPTINKLNPLPLNDWFKAIGNSQTGKYCFVLPDKYFFNSSYHTGENNELVMLFDGSFFDYENPAKDNLAVEKGLAITDMVKQIFNTHIAPLMHSNDEHDMLVLEDLKAVFGNATALDMLFSQNISGYTDNTTLRYVMTNYSAIISEAKKIFNTRLLYWTDVVNKLL